MKLTTNVFELAHKKTLAENTNNAILNKYKQRSFFDRTKGVTVFLIILAGLCSIISALTEAIYIKQEIQNIGLSNHFGLIVLTVFIVVCVEMVKRFVLPQIFRYYYQFKTLDYINITIYTLTAVFSIYCSFGGATITPTITSKPQLINIDSVANYHDVIILNKAKEKEQYFIRNQYAGKINHKLAPTYNTLVMAVGEAETEKQKAINKAIEDNKSITVSHNANNDKKGVKLGYITLISELILLLIIAFTNYREYRQYMYLVRSTNIATAQDMQVQEAPIFPTLPRSAPAPTPAPAGQQRQPHNENRNNETIHLTNNENRCNNVKTSFLGENENRNKRTCLHCNSDYIIRHHKQKYCKDDCRIQAYQERKKKSGKVGKTAVYFPAESENT